MPLLRSHARFYLLLMKKINDLLFKLAEVTLVVMLSTMVVMVFGNVVLRYCFNDGIIVSEELSRFLFIWITFLGAVIAMRENAHLGLDSVVRMLPRVGKKACFAISNLLMLVCCVLMFYGTWRQHHINATTMSAVLELPMSWVYGVGYVASISMGLMIVGKLIRLATGKISDDELIQVHDSEEDASPHMQHDTRSAGATK